MNTILTHTRPLFYLFAHSQQLQEIQYFAQGHSHTGRPVCELSLSRQGSHNRLDIGPQGEEMPKEIYT